MRKTQIAKPVTDDVVFSSQIVTGLRALARQVGKFDRRLEKVEGQIKTAGLNGHGPAIQKIASLAEPLTTIAGMETDLKEVVQERRDRSTWQKEQDRLNDARRKQEASAAEASAHNPLMKVWRLLGGHAITGVASASAGAIIGHLLK